MKNKLVMGVLIVVALLLVVWILTRDKSDVSYVDPLPQAQGPLDISYVVDRTEFLLVNGKAEKEIVPDSATKNILRVFGEPVYGDLNGDGNADAALLLENQPGGSGTFYYATLAINQGNGVYKSTNTLILGDRIAPQTVEIRDGRAVFNYAIRRADENFTVQPSIGKSLWIHIDPNTGEIGEWVKDFEGESNIPRPE